MRATKPCTSNIYNLVAKVGTLSSPGGECLNFGNSACGCRKNSSQTYHPKPPWSPQYQTAAYPPMWRDRGGNPLKIIERQKWRLRRSNCGDTAPPVVHVYAEGQLKWSPSCQMRPIKQTLPNTGPTGNFLSTEIPVWIFKNQWSDVY